MNMENSDNLFRINEDMQAMGKLFAYSDRYARKLCGFEGRFDNIKFAEALLTSGMHSELDHRWLIDICESAEDVFMRYYEGYCEKSLEQFRAIKSQPAPDINRLYWIGQVYTYIHHSTDMPYKDMLAHMPLKEMMTYYDTGHKLDICIFCDSINKMFTGCKKKTYVSPGIEVEEVPLYNIKKISNWRSYFYNEDKKLVICKDEEAYKEFVQDNEIPVWYRPYIMVEYSS